MWSEIRLYYKVCLKEMTFSGHYVLDHAHQSSSRHHLTPPRRCCFCGTFFFGNLGDIRTARTKQESIRASKSRLNSPLTDGHLSRKSGGADSTVLWDCEESRGGGEVSAEAAVFPLFRMGSGYEKILRCGSRDGHRTGERGVLPLAVGRSSAGRPATDRAAERIFSPCRPFVAQIDQVNSY